MRAIIFDIDDTLYDLAEPFEKTVYQYYHDVYEGIDINKLFKAMRRHSDEVFDDSESGKITMDDMYVYRFEKAFQDFNINISREEALKFQHTYEQFQQNITIPEAMQGCLDKLTKMPVFLGIISNGAYEHQMDKIHRLGLARWFPKEHILISGGCPYSKPDVRIFKYAEKKMKLEPADTWYAGDTFKNDITGPEAAGWHAIWFNHRGYTMPEGAVVPDYTVTNEEDFISLLLKIGNH